MSARGTKAFCFEHMDEAVAEQGGSDFPARNLAYTFRRMLKAAGFTVHLKTGMKYLTQKVIPWFVEERGPIPGLFWEARGVLVEPHTRRRTPLGTREAGDYELPAYSFANLLIIEKLGYEPAVLDGDLLERFDLAVMFSQGYATTGARRIVAAMARQDVRIFTVHDADLDGYNLARVIGERTERMPGHNVEVTDLGLTIEEGIERGLAAEPFEPKALKNGTLIEPPQGLVESLTPVARDWLLTRRLRFELNALEPIPVFLDWLRRKIEAEGIEKVIPPDDVTLDHAHDEAEAWVEAEIDVILAVLLDLDALRQRLVPRVTRAAQPTAGWAAGLAEAFGESPTDSWRNVVDASVGEATRRLRSEIKDELADLLDGWRRPRGG